jgi:hypothetical protein
LIDIKNSILSLSLSLTHTRSPLKFARNKFTTAKSLKGSFTIFIAKKICYNEIICSVIFVQGISRLTRSSMQGERERELHIDKCDTIFFAVDAVKKNNRIEHSAEYSLSLKVNFSEQYNAPL